MTHSPGMTYPMYQCLPYPPQFGHLQFGTQTKHSSNLGVGGLGITDTRRVYILASIYGQVRERVSYTIEDKGKIVSMVCPKQELFGCLNLCIMAGTCKEQDTNLSK